MNSVSSEYNGAGLVAVAVTLLCVTCIAVPLRVFVRLYVTRSFAADDWFIVLSQIIFTCTCAFVLLGIQSGLGRHVKSLPIENQIEAKKYQALATLFYIGNMMFIKISIALFLLRIAVQKRYIWILRISVIIVAIWTTAIFFFDLFQCWPIESQWNKTLPKWKCVSASSFVSAAYSISVMTILSDWLYALLPIPMIWSVNMSVQTKATVAFVLSLGIFASIATLVRMKYLIQLKDNSDNLFTATNSMIWTLVEPGIAIVAASLITMRPLLRAMRFPGFETDPTQYPHPSIRITNDMLSDQWKTSSTSTQVVGNSGARMGNSKDGVNKKVHTRAVVGEGGSEEYILEGITRTIDVTVERDGFPRRPG